MVYRQLTIAECVELLARYHKDIDPISYPKPGCKEPTEYRAVKNKIRGLINRAIDGGLLVQRDDRLNESSLLTWAAKKLKKGEHQFPGVPDKYYFVNTGVTSMTLRHIPLPSTLEGYKSALLKAWGELADLQKENEALKAENKEYKNSSEYHKRNARSRPPEGW